MFPRESDREIRSAIHHIQIELNPHKSETEAIRPHRLRLKEFQEFIKLMGVPSGYKEEYND
ncbi:hypothetical protein [Christiangramia marina]|uniref:hypothetical protein n=1 Tax=Christiangramia marina TaxID=409436 RepID=UPI003AA9C769